MKDFLEWEIGLHGKVEDVFSQRFRPGVGKAFFDGDLDSVQRWKSFPGTRPTCTPIIPREGGYFTLERREKCPIFQEFSTSPARFSIRLTRKVIQRLGSADWPKSNTA